MYVILAISVVVLALFFVMSGTDGAYGRDTGVFTDFNGLDIMLMWSYVLLAVGILAAVVMTLANIGKSEGGGKSGVVVMIILALALVVSYFISSPDPIQISGGTKTFDDKLGLVVTDMGLYTSYIMMAVALIVVVFGGLLNNIRK